MTPLGQDAWSSSPGLGLAFVSLTIGAVTGIPRRQAGLASGLINSSQQIGGALGLAGVVGPFLQPADSTHRHAPGRISPIPTRPRGSCPGRCPASPAIPVSS
jgi:hypothetical protein